MEKADLYPSIVSGLAELARGKTYTPSINGKAVLNTHFLRVHSLVRFKRLTIGLSARARRLVWVITLDIASVPLIPSAPNHSITLSLFNIYAH
jgi:hypothetical protein